MIEYTESHVHWMSIYQIEGSEGKQKMWPKSIF